MEIYKIGFPILNHHVPGLEVPVHEGLMPLILQEVILKFFQVILQPGLVELQTGSLEETILEVVEVKHNHPPVEGRIRITDRPVKSLGPLELYLREGLHGPAKKHALVGAVLTAFPAVRDQFIKLVVAKVFLNISHPVFRDFQHLRNPDSLLDKMPGQLDKSVVLLDIGTHYTDNGDIPALEAEISPVTSGRVDLFRLCHFLTGIAFE